VLHAASGYALIALFAACAIGATYAARRDDDLRMVGGMLILNLLLSNLVVAMTRDPQARAGVFTMVEILVAVAAYLAYAMGAPHRALIAVVSLCLISISSTVAYALIHAPSRETINLWHLVTNGCFVLNCLLVGVTGRRDAVGSDNFWSWARRDRRPAQPNAVDG
jgi:hypothetical protein